MPPPPPPPSSRHPTAATAHTAHTHHLTYARRWEGQQPYRFSSEVTVTRWQPGSLVVLDFEAAGVGLRGVGELFVEEVWGARLVAQSEGLIW